MKGSRSATEAAELGVPRGDVADRQQDASTRVYARSCKSEKLSF